MPNSVLRRYTPPTCKLEILARSSPASRWTGQSGSKQLQFELSFDDARLPEQQQVIIQGDRDQLEDLHEAVTTYVQDLLKSSPERFNAVFSALAPTFPSSPKETSSSSTAVDSSTPRSPDLSVNDFQTLSEEPQPLDPFYASAHLVPSAAEEPTAAPSGKIFLQPSSGLAHNLFLGPLATKESGSIIRLSMLQLFDLATALDKYAADVVTLPTLSRSRVAAVPSAWANIAAVLVLALGLTTAVVLFNRSDSQQQTANRNANQGSSNNNQQPSALQGSPVPTLGVPTPPLSSPETLPSLPPVASIVPSPSPSIPTATLPGIDPPLPGNPQASIPQTIPVSPIPGITPAPPILVPPVPRQNGVSIPREGATPRTGEMPSFSVAPPTIVIPSPSSQLTPPNPNQETASSEANGAAPADSSDTPTTEQRRDSASQTRSPSIPITPGEPRGTVFDTIPQVAEARDYFKQRWEPPATLKQTIEYSLVLDVDGTIQRIEPLGQAARTYVDRTGMPLIGERFVSQNKNGQTPRIRVVLAPDGKVQTFLEEDTKPSPKS